MHLMDRISFEMMGLLMFPIFIYAEFIYIIQAPLFNWNVPLGYVAVVMSIITFLVLIILFCRDITFYIKAKKRIRKRKWMSLDQAIELIKERK